MCVHACKCHSAHSVGHGRSRVCTLQSHLPMSAPQSGAGKHDEELSEERVKFSNNKESEREREQ